MDANSSSPETLKALAAQLSTAANAYTGPMDIANHKKITDVAKQILDESREPWMEYLIAMAEMNIVHFFVSHKGFDPIPDDGAISVEELAQKINAQPALIQRFANVLTGCGILIAPTYGFVAHTKVSKTFKSGTMQSMGFAHIWKVLAEPCVQWPGYFELNGLTEPKRANQVPFGFANGHPDKTAFEILAMDAKKSAENNQAMTMFTSMLPISGIYDYKWVIEYASQHAEEQRAIIVDVGGGKGQALKAILKENTQIPASRCVLEDLPHVIADAEAENDEQIQPVQKVGYDFFQPQPIKGEKVHLQSPSCCRRPVAPDPMPNTVCMSLHELRLLLQAH